MPNHRRSRATASRHSRKLSTYSIAAGTMRISFEFFDMMSNDRNESFFVHHRLIAGNKPPISQDACAQILLTEIPLHQVRAAPKQHAWLAGRKWLECRGVGDAAGNPRQRLAHGPWLAPDLGEILQCLVEEICRDDRRHFRAIIS